MATEIRQLTAEDLPLMDGLVHLFATAFHDPDSYLSKRPSEAYLRSLLASETFLALVAIRNGGVIAGLAAYELRKFEQERSEIYIYDLAVATEHRRQGLATALIRELQAIAADRGAYVIFVQADTAEEDRPAIELYTKLGAREEVLHFDIEVNR